MRKSGLLFIVLGFFLMAGIGQAATVGVSPALTEVGPGDTFTVSLLGTEFGDTRGGDVLVEFDSSQFSTSDSDITFTWTGSSKGATVKEGSVSISVGAFGSPISGDFGIADISFAVADDAFNGSHLLALSVSAWTDGNFAELDPQPDASGGTVNVSVVPIPSAIFLLGGGLVSLFAVRRRKRA